MISVSSSFQNFKLETSKPGSEQAAARSSRSFTKQGRGSTVSSILTSALKQPQRCAVSV